jgi:hypothetical protein
MNTREVCGLSSQAFDNVFWNAVHLAQAFDIPLITASTIGNGSKKLWCEFPCECFFGPQLPRTSLRSPALLCKQAAVQACNDVAPQPCKVSASTVGDSTLSLEVL